MTTFDWPDLMTRWNRALFASSFRTGWRMERQPADVLAAGWLGHPGATEAQLAELEEHLGARLPPSYRQFLQVTNGWRQLSGFIDRVWSTDEVEWLSIRNQDLIDIWTEHEFETTDEEYFVYGDEQYTTWVRSEYFGTALEISDWGDSAILILNPRVVTSEGEWEAWVFANWNPGAVRYRSFWELMRAEYASFLRLEEFEEA